mgnify:CR=1 FL=1
MSTTPIKGNPASAKPMPGLSERGQKLLNQPRHSLTLGPRNTGIPAAFRTTNGGA